jgi:hypothetical protein
MAEAICVGGPELANCFTIHDRTSAVLTAPAIVTVYDLDWREGEKNRKSSKASCRRARLLPNGEVELKFRAGAKSSSGNHRLADWSAGTSLTQSLRVSAFSISLAQQSIPIILLAVFVLDSYSLQLVSSAVQNLLDHRIASNTTKPLDKPQ